MRKIGMLLAVGALWLPAALAGDEAVVVLGGDVGNAACACEARLRFAPFNSLPWLRADLTGERVSEFDDEWGQIMNRPFKNFSGDISGRFIEVMAMDSQGNRGVHPAFKGLLEEVLRQQRPGGYFCASGVIDWQKPIDYDGKRGMEGWGRMMPALWGNARLLCGLVEAMRAFPEDKAIADAARRLGDFYVSMLPRFNDPARMDEYVSTGSYAAGHATCWFPAMEGLVKLGKLTGERKYVDAAAAMAGFYEKFDRIPIDHAHGMLCNQVALVLLTEATKAPHCLVRVEKRWNELVTGGYINPAGGILEKCHVKFGRDEGCAIVDWLRFNLLLGWGTGKARYWDMAERTLHNHFLQNQGPKGGFGHRRILCDDQGAYGFGDAFEESTWCCSFHGELGFINLRNYLMKRDDGKLTCNFALDFTAKDHAGTTYSMIRPGIKTGEILRQRISPAGPAVVVRIRKPDWADAVTAEDAAGQALSLHTTDGWCETVRPVNEVEFVFGGGIIAEDRRCKRFPNGPQPGMPFVLRHGPKLLAAAGGTAAAPAWPYSLESLNAAGIRPFDPRSLPHKDCCFVFGLAP